MIHDRKSTEGMHTCLTSNPIFAEAPSCPSLLTNAEASLTLHALLACFGFKSLELRVFSPDIVLLFNSKRQKRSFCRLNPNLQPMIFVLRSLSP